MLILTDLDDTLFQTARKCPPEDRALLAVSYLADGQESGFATRRQQHMLDWLQQGKVVPVTARSRAVLGRVKIEQHPAICSNGGCIVTANGDVDADWHARLHEQSRRGVAPADAYAQLRHVIAGEEYRHWLVQEGDLDLYLVVKSNIDEGDMLKDVEPSLNAMLPEGWRTHRNGNNLAFLPPWLNKRDAARYLIENARAVDHDLLVVGVGDSHSDVGFMDLCDYAMTPTTSQVWAEMKLGNVWCC
ncbi:sucrose-6-phosphate hydrolase [Novosphingobium sp. AAP1]|uniref:sucrose-6-phosphate hydrolase n=1 Tax=unclassified Novosphingobium TaxID=2644732 RepID=UPI0004917F72|nr:MULTISPECIES: sucrose-6-phosphate hydrolase [unclassified Novosphingobium]KPF53255.1 sucrose-6-phosphate hydrolase [Novosphingobium sp. AAP1]